MIQHSTKYIKILLKNAEQAITIQCLDGSFKQGHNGPWNDTDSKVRTTCHWANVLSYAYYYSNEEKFKISAKKAFNWILKRKNRPHNFSYLCRQEKGKNSQNGMIGPAWVLESLLYGLEYLGDKRLIYEAKSLIDIYPFDKNTKLYQMIEVTGENIGIELTINQQIWFSSLVAKYEFLTGDQTFCEDIDTFWISLKNNIYFVEPGLICHYAKVEDSLSNTLKKRVKNFLTSKKNKLLIRDSSLTDGIVNRSKGYQSFILYAIATAYQVPKIKLTIDKELLPFLRKSYNYLLENFFTGVVDDPWSYQYNCTGFECAYFNLIFMDTLNLQDNVVEWIEKQIELHFSTDDTMCENTTDPVILASRIYEIIPLLENGLK